MSNIFILGFSKIKCWSQELLNIPPVIQFIHQACLPDLYKVWLNTPIREYFWVSPENPSNLRKFSYNCGFELIYRKLLEALCKSRGWSKPIRKKITLGKDLWDIHTETNYPKYKLQIDALTQKTILVYSHHQLGLILQDYIFQNIKWEVYFNLLCSSKRTSTMEQRKDTK